MSKLQLAQRQIHLDFHTGPSIPDVGADFDAKAFARTMKKAHVNSVTVFAKCHHGHLYFPTKHPARHPNLKKGLDLVGDQVDALHREGIRAPIYISVQCDEFAANTHPEWIARNADGSGVGAHPLQPGWQILDMSSPYQDFLAEQLAEVLQRYKPVDGIFFDMCWDQPSLSKWAKARMLELGYDPAVEADRVKYSHRVSLEYMNRYYKMVRKVTPAATVYFNSRPLSFLADDIPFLTHVEIEALATGGWGYLYFPKNVRFARTFGRPYMGMTARFHKSWADFGGLKPQPALKYEVCQMLAHGAECSIGDQLHPRGELDKAVYDLIGDVYGYAESCEPFTQGATPVTQIGLFKSGPAGQYHEAPGSANDGATRMLTQLKHQFDVVSAASKLEDYRLLVVPDGTVVDEALAARLKKFVAAGGSMIIAGDAAVTADHKPVLPELGFTCQGVSPFTTTYFRFGPQVDNNAPATEHVMYEAGLRMLPAKGAETLARIVEPYFERNYKHFSSHFQTPPKPNASVFAAALRKGRVITISYPIFRAYGTHSNIPYRTLVANCIDLLMPERLVTIAAPSTTEVTVMKQGKRTVVHLLQFVADRRNNLDICEDIIPLYDVKLAVRLPKAPKSVYLAPQMQAIPFHYEGGVVSLVIPKIEGHAMVVFE